MNTFAKGQRNRMSANPRLYKKYKKSFNKLNIVAVLRYGLFYGRLGGKDVKTTVYAIKCYLMA